MPENPLSDMVGQHMLCQQILQYQHMKQKMGLIRNTETMREKMNYMKYTVYEELNKVPGNQHIVDTRWVYRLKKNPDSSTKWKAHLTS
jgi:hypothetical protein